MPDLKGAKPALKPATGAVGGTPVARTTTPKPAGKEPPAFRAQKRLAEQAAEPTTPNPQGA